MEISLSLNELETCDTDEIVQAIEYVQYQIDKYGLEFNKYVIDDISIIIGG